MYPTGPFREAVAGCAGALEECLLTQGLDVSTCLLHFSRIHSDQVSPDMLDEYTRRQYVAKAPKRNPFGEEELPRKFADLDIFTKVRVLQQLATWTLNNPTTIRDKLEEGENEQLAWVCD